MSQILDILRDAGDRVATDLLDALPEGCSVGPVAFVALVDDPAFLCTVYSRPTAGTAWADPERRARLAAGLRTLAAELDSDPVPA